MKNNRSFCRTFNTKLKINDTKKKNNNFFREILRQHIEIFFNIKIENNFYKNIFITGYMLFFFFCAEIMGGHIRHNSKRSLPIVQEAIEAGLVPKTGAITFEIDSQVIF